MSRKKGPEREEIRKVSSIEIACDLCGAIARSQNYSSKESRWTEELHETSASAVYCKTGSSYPSGDYGEEIVADICPDCFQSKLVPWLRSQGANIQSQEYD